MDPRSAKIEHLHVFFEDFFINSHPDDDSYMDNLIISTNKGYQAMLYARSHNDSHTGASRTLQHMVDRWQQDGHKFHYSTAPLPKALVDRKSFKNGKMRGTDTLLTIMSVDLNALHDEVHSAKNLLTSFGLRHMGPLNPEKETFYEFDCQRSDTQTRTVQSFFETKSSISTPAIGLPMLSAATVGTHQSEATDTQHQNSLNSTKSIPVGATREWLFLRAIAVEAGVPGQPVTLLKTYESIWADDKLEEFVGMIAIDESADDYASRKDYASQAMDDAVKVRQFILNHLDTMYDRFMDMSQSNETWSVSRFADTKDDVERRNKNKALFSDIAETLHSIRVQAQYSLAGAAKTVPYEGNLFDRLNALGKDCHSVGNIGWAGNNLISLAYCAELLDILEHGAMLFQNKTLERIKNRTSSLSDYTMSLCQDKEMVISSGYGQRVEGRLMKANLLPLSYAEEFPCVDTGDGRLVMVPGASIEPDANKPSGSGYAVLVVPCIPQAPQRIVSSVRSDIPAPTEDERNAGYATDINEFINPNNRGKAKP